MLSSLVGKKVVIRANEFITVDTIAIITIVDGHKERLLLKLDKPIIDKEITYSFVIASPRLHTTSLNSLIDDGVMGSSLYWIPKDKINHNNPFNLSWWRGGAVGISDIYL